MSDPSPVTPTISLPAGFRFDEVLAEPRLTAAPTGPPSLGPLANFVGTWTGRGFNTIFRPDNSVTPTAFPTPVTPVPDNVLELNLTTEQLSFSASLGNVPNRGRVQGDAFLNGVPYVQTIQDVTTGAPTGIHFEPGLWMIVPNTKDPKEGVSLVRMASIPHGTTICAQGTFTTLNGAPNIPSVSITPFVTGAPHNPILFPSQTAANSDTPRIPQNLTAGAGGLTEATWQNMLQNPNIVLRNAISGQRITETTVISISTNPNSPLFGGGTDNIAFLLGNASALTAPQNPVENAQTLQMSATFWIETVEHTIIVPIFHPGEPPLTLKAESTEPGQVVPTFLVRPPIPIPAPRPITVFSKQIQYSQVVMLNFAGLTWPHVSVATLVPSGSLPVPPSVWDVKPS